MYPFRIITVYKIWPTFLDTVSSVLSGTAESSLE